MNYKILSSLRTPSSIEAQSILEKQVQEVLDAGGQLAGVSVVFGVSTDNDKPGFEVFQAVLIPKT